MLACETHNAPKLRQFGVTLRDELVAKDPDRVGGMRLKLQELREEYS